MPKLFTRTDSQTTKATIALYRSEARHDKNRLIGAAILIPLATMAYTVLIPLFLSLIIQSLITSPDNLTPIYWLVGAIAIASLLTIVFNDRGYRWLFNHEEIMTTRLIQRAVNHLLARSHGFFANNKVGSLTGDLIAFGRSYMSIMDAVFLQALSIIVNFIASLIIIAFLSPILLLPLLLLTTTIVYMSIRSLLRRAPLRNERKKRTSHLNGTIADVIGNSLLVRVFARTPKETNDILKERATIERIATKEVDIIQTEANTRYVVLFSFQILTILLSVWLFVQGNLAIAALIFTVTYLGRVTSSLFGITGFIRAIEQSFLDASPITKILSEEIEIKDAANARDIKVARGMIECQSIRFQYNDTQDKAVFNNLSLTIPAGQRVGLAGHSGGGKTTLTQLLLRFADVQEGAILIDGQNIAEVTQSSLYANIAYVPQDPFLFHRTLRENIAYGKPNASDDEILEAAGKAHAIEFIDKLPYGLDTIVGERGVKLSGGQRQRIAIARAILKDAPILILDEATSALDSESEKLIQDALEKLMKNRTSIVIAHRLSTIAKLDRIIVLDNGSIAEQGTHDELLLQKGIYASLWSHQSGGFIEE